MFRRRTGRLPITLCCLTDQDPGRTSRAIAPLANAVEQVIVGVAATAPSPARSYRRLGTVLELPPLRPGADLEEAFTASSPTLRAPWKMVLHADEVVSSELVAFLGRVSEEEPHRIAVHRRWLADARHVLRGLPWDDDRPIRIRPAADHGRIEPDRQITAPLYTATAILRAPAEREARALAEAVRRPHGPGTMREPEALRWHPERAALVHGEAVLEDDVPRVRALVGTAGIDGLRMAGVLDGARETGDEATVAIGPVGPTWDAGRAGVVTVTVGNRSERVWRSGDSGQEGAFFVGHHWTTGDGVRIDGPRTAFPDPVVPGGTAVVRVPVRAPEAIGPATLGVAVVEEHVRWLAPQLDALVDVVEPAPLPVRRERVSSPASTPIPKVFHRIWVGGNSMPEDHVEYGRTWERLHPGWEMRLWTDDDIPELAAARLARSISEHSDLLRYEILRRHGGVYVDTDIECLRPIDSLIEGVSCFSAYEVPGRLCPALMGATPGHPAIARLCDLVGTTVGLGTYPQATGTVFSTYVLEARDDVTLFGPDRFSPRLWDGTATPGGAPPYADHHWTMSWQGQDGSLTEG